MKAYNNVPESLTESLINTYDTFLEEPEHLQTHADLRAFLERHEIAIIKPPTDADLEAVRLLRETLRGIWNAKTLSRAVEHLNRLFAAIYATPQVAQREGDKVSLTMLVNPQESLVKRLTLACALDIVTLLQTYGQPRLRFCASAPCKDVFVDTSRNRTRRFCSDRCANRYNVAAFRERKGTRQDHKEH